MKFYYRNVYADGSSGSFCDSKAGAKACRSTVRRWIGVNVLARDPRTGDFVIVCFEPA